MDYVPPIPILVLILLPHDQLSYAYAGKMKRDYALRIELSAFQL